ncbi:hypothetical protein D3C74_422040 [compost metagenome]
MMKAVSISPKISHPIAAERKVSVAGSAVIPNGKATSDIEIIRMPMRMASFLCLLLEGISKT